MAKAKNKTVPTGLKLSDYLAQIEPATRREDCQVLHDMMFDLTGWTAKMWGTKLSSAIIGFGTYHYKYESGREGDSLRIGFASRAQSISIYIMPGYQNFSQELARLGKYKTGKSCLYIKKLADVDQDVLREILQKGLDIMAKKYPITEDHA